MLKPRFVLIISLLITVVAAAQQPNKPSSSDIYESIQKLNFLGSVLYIAAHPDDENTRLISYMSNHLNARTAYLSLTRGDGGQNLIGQEIRELLGVIRTQELLAARRVDGGEQLFTRANDFGFSKSPNETLKIWDEDNVLGDVVWALRTFRPDIIINRFNDVATTGNHGHHTSSAILSIKAFDLAGDENQFTDQLNHTTVWQPKSLYFNTHWWFYGSQEKFDAIDKSKMLHFDIGTYYAHKGLSNNEIAAMASSQHLSQGFGRATSRGSQLEYIDLIKGDYPEDGKDPFYGIDTSWNRIKGGEAIGHILNAVEENFNFKDPSVHVTDLLEAYKLVSKLEDEHWKAIKLKALKLIIEACSGLYLEVSSDTPTASKGSTITLNIETLNRSKADIELASYVISSVSDPFKKNTTLTFNSTQNFSETVTIPENMASTSPYWLEEQGTLGMYTVNDRQLIGLPESPRSLKVDFNLLINGSPITITKDVIYRYSKPDKGELYRPFEIIPEVSASLDEDVHIFENDAQKDIQVIVKAGRDSLEGYVSMNYPKDWNVFPDKQNISIASKGEHQTLVFTVIPPKYQSEGKLTPEIHIGENIYTKELIEIDYSHIPFQTVLMPSESKLVRLDIQKRGENIGYIEGAGDTVPESLEHIGYNVVTIKPEDINENTLSRFDAIVVGIRAYNTIDELKHKQKTLFDFVEQGGNLIVQYNTNFRLKVDELAPYHLKLSRDRVTEEQAEVRFIDPNHEVLNYPNKITQKDFEGWTQERGLYFPSEWSDDFSPILSMNDVGESPKNGSLLVAKHGEGHYIYTGLSFFREFPEGVSGAYRLFANMLSIGKDNINLNAKLND